MILSVCISNHLLRCVSGGGMFGFGPTSHAACWSRVRWCLSQLPSAQILSAVHCAKNGSLQSFTRHFQGKCKASSIINCFLKWQLTVLLATWFVMVQCYELLHIGLFLIHSSGVPLLDARLITNCRPQLTQVNSWHWKTVIWRKSDDILHLNYNTCSYGASCLLLTIKG